MTSSPDQPENPYVGPRAFDTEDREKFFGRERETRDLRHLLVAERIVLLYAPSGAGKTSLIKAALSPRLRDEKFRVLPVIRVNTPLPDDLNGGSNNRYLLSALQSLEKGLVEAGVLTEQRTPAELAGMGLVDYLERLPRPEDGAQRDVLIFDQFEEILTVDPNSFEARDDRRAFFQQVGDALGDRRRWALFVLREDYLAGLDPYLGPIPTRLATRFRLDLLEDEAATRAIREPARGFGVEFSETAAVELVGDLLEVRVSRNGKVEEEKGLYVEPVHLQVVCFRLWDKLRPAHGAEITEEQVEHAADVDTTLADYYDEQVQKIAASENGATERRIREWFDRQLITPQGIRGQVPKGPETSGGLDNEVVEALAKAQLVRREMRLNAIWYELSHDRLIDPVRKSNAAWFDRTLQVWQHDAERWASHDESPDLVARGAVLRQAERWAGDHPQELTAAERRFIKASQDARFRSRRNRVALILGVLAVLFVAAVFYLGTEVRRQARVTFARHLAAQAQSEINPVRGLLLAIESQEISPSVDADQALRNGLDLLPRSVAPLVHKDVVNVVAFSHDGQWVATGSNDGTARVWETETGREVARMRHESGEAVFDIAFSHDDKWLATGAGNPKEADPSAAVVWDLTTGREIAQLPHESAVVAVDFSPDGGLVATASLDSTARVWDTADWSQLYQLPHDGSLTSLAFSPNGRQLATGSRDSISRTWDMETGREVARVEQDNTVNIVAFSPDGRWVASGEGCPANQACPATVLVWDASTGLKQTTVTHSIDVNTLAFSPDSHFLATGSGDRTARVWEVATGREVSRMSHGQAAAVWSLAFSPDGTQLATASSDGIARVWESFSGRELVRVAHDKGVPSVAFSPGGEWFATASEDGTARVWESTADEEPLRTDLGGWGYSVSFSPDGQLLATGSDNPVAPVWQVGTGHVVGQLAHEDSAPVVLFSPEGHRFATGAKDAKVRIVDSRSGEELGLVNVADGGEVETLDFSPDGDLLAIGSTNGSVQVWDASAKRVVAEMADADVEMDQADDVWQVAFSPDGRWLGSASQDGMTRVWEAGTDREILHQEQANPVDSVVFSPDGRWVASGEACPPLAEACTAFVYVWELETGRQLARMTHEHTVASMQFSHDGGWLATASWDNSVVVWDTATWQSHARLLHDGGLQDVEFSPDDKWLATASEDFTARLWEVASGAQVAEMVHDGLVMDVDFSPDGQLLATAAGDATARTWLVWSDDLKTEACNRLPRNLTRDEWAEFVDQDAGWAEFLGQDAGWIEFLGTDVPYEPTCPNLPADLASLGATPASAADANGNHSASPGLVETIPASVPGDVPTWAPLPTPTPIPTQSVTHVVGSTFTSASYGYSVTWDNSVWWVAYEYSANGYDHLRLRNGASNVDLKAYVGFGGDPAACLDYALDLERAVEGRSFFAPMSDGNSTPSAGQDPTHAHAAYKYRYTRADGSSEDWLLRLECRMLVPGESVLEIAQVTTPDSYDEQLAALEELLDGLSLPEPAAGATPAA
jgi:WD40 repeat protein